MPTLIENDLAATLEALRAQVAEVTKRLAALEKSGEGAISAPVAAAIPEQPAAAPPVAPPAPAGITEEEMLAVSAAIAAYLGVRAHIRQIRLLSTTAWSQQGRVSIQASHRLQG